MPPLQSNSLSYTTGEHKPMSNKWDEKLPGHWKVWTCAEALDVAVLFYHSGIGNQYNCSIRKKLKELVSTILFSNNTENFVDVQQVE